MARNAQKVIGIEYVPEAIEDAKINSALNNIHNTVFYAGDMKDVLNEEFIRRHGHPDVIITDPPRAGMHKDVVDTILKAAPDRIVYVSCNSATQARDLALMDADYEVMAVQAVDMFPHTHHVEKHCFVTSQIRIKTSEKSRSFFYSLLECKYQSASSFPLSLPNLRISDNKYQYAYFPSGSRKYSNPLCAHKRY